MEISSLLANVKVQDLVTIVGFVGWFFRLESKVKYLEKDYEENKSIVRTKVESIESGIRDVLTAVGRLEGRIQRDDE